MNPYPESAMDQIQSIRSSTFRSLLVVLPMLISAGTFAAPILLDPLESTASLLQPGAQGGDLKDGTNALAAGDSVAAQAAFMRALSRRPDDVMALLGMASSMQMKGERLEALNWTLRAISRQPTNATVLEAHTRLSVENNDLPGAIERVEDIVNDHPDALPPAQALGRLYLLNRQPEKAVEQLERVVDRPGSDVTARIDLGTALLSAGRVDDAAQMLDAVRRQLPGTTLALSPLARAEFARRKPEIALAHLVALESAQRLTPGDLVLKGDVLTALSRHGDAVAAYERAAEAAPKDVFVALKRAQALDSAGRPADAMAAYESVLEQDGDNLIALNNAAYLAAAQGIELDTALERARRALRIGAQSAALYDTLAAVQLARGDGSGARDALSRALSIDPAHTSARERLARLEANAAATPKVAEPEKQSPAPVVVAAAAAVAAEAPREAPTQTTPASSPQLAAADTPPPDAAPAPVEVEPAPAPDPVRDQAELSDALEAWRQAWQSERYEAYVAAYVDDASPVAGMSRKRWEEDRQRKLSKPGRLEIALESVEWTRIDNDTWTSRFVQHYASSNYRDKSLKTLHWSRRSGQWRIEREASKTL